jgi:hypothetical protein
MYTRKQIFEGSENESMFVWGARQTGKSTLLKALFPNAFWIDLLLTNDYERFSKNPGLIREKSFVRKQTYWEEELCVTNCIL